MEKNLETSELRFEAPSFFKRLKGMLGVDFYRLFHTPLLYIFLVIAALIPALVSMGAMGGEGETAGMFTNAWQIIAANNPLYVVNDIGEYANMNMVFIFGGIMISIFIGHDYKSGYVKQLFTTHAKKQDYILSKSLLGAFSMACMYNLPHRRRALGRVYGIALYGRRGLARLRHSRQTHHEFGLGKPVFLYQRDLPLEVRHLHCPLLLPRHGNPHHRRGGARRQHPRSEYLPLRLVGVRLPIFKLCVGDRLPCLLRDMGGNLQRARLACFKQARRELRGAV